MSDYSDEYFETPDEDATDAEDEEGDDATELAVEDGALAKVKAMIAAGLASGQLKRDKAKRLLDSTRNLEQRMETEYQELCDQQFPDEFDAFLASKAMYGQHLKAQRAIEFAALGIDLGGVASDYDHMLKNLSCPEYDKERAINAQMYRSLSLPQRAEFKQRVLSKGELTAEELDRLIAENWE